VSRLLRRVPVHRRKTALLAVVGLLLALLLWLDWRSLERGNRLYRDGGAAAASELYRDQVGEAPSVDRASYNLGTALLADSPAEADRYLAEAANTADSALAHRSSYNLGYGRLTRVDPSLSPDSALQLLRASVTASRAALRLDIDDENARWNLALGQRMIDSLTFNMRLLDRQQPSGLDETRLQDQALTRSNEGAGISGLEPEEPPPTEGLGERRGGALGAREAWASQDPGPISDQDARLLLTNLQDDPEQMVRGLLWAHRPDVAWWNAEPYPGGNW
jgi:hypothetical protein